MTDSTHYDNNSICTIALSGEHFAELQKYLQIRDFNVNNVCIENGDFLVHVIVQKGLSYLPLLMTLVSTHEADIDLMNARGMTPLMLAADSGDTVLCDVLICLLTADPNKPNTQTGRSALHYAAAGKHRTTVQCLINRGADVNMEDLDGLRADDIQKSASDDCREIIRFNRTKRMETLTDLVLTEKIMSSHIFLSDFCGVDDCGNTLIMTAATNNKWRSLSYLLDISSVTVNAQHGQTGRTALSIAAILGHLEAVEVLLRYKASPTIADMDGYLPLQHAVMNNQALVVHVLINYFSKTNLGLYKAMQLCQTSDIYETLKFAWKKRQEKIVAPKLLECAVNGQAEDLYRLLEEGDCITQQGGTCWPMCVAAKNGYVEVMQLLYEHGGDVTTRHPVTGETLLHIAAKMGHLHAVSYLLQFCTDSRSSPQLCHRRTQPGSSSKWQQCKDKPQSYLDINSVDGQGQTALHAVVERGFSHIVQLLLAHGATTSIVDTEGRLLTCSLYEGIQVALETRRRHHTLQIMACIEDNSRKSLSALKKLWLPRFDHHLRNSKGNTPLMVAAETGNIPIIQFLLESAVYSEIVRCDHKRSQADDEDSDTDSGVLDLTSGSPPQDCSSVLCDLEASLDSVTSTDAHENKYELFNANLQRRSSNLPDMSDFHPRKMAAPDSGGRTHKEQTIYHNGLVSHVCAVNLKDGTNALHHALYHSDAPDIISLISRLDPTPLNMQDDGGETPLHLACRLGRRKSVEFILARPEVDLSVCNCEGLLPGELTTSKSIRRMLEKAGALPRGLVQNSRRRSIWL